MIAPRFDNRIEGIIDLSFRSKDGRLLIQQHEYEIRVLLDKLSRELAPSRTVEIGTYKGWMSALLSHVTSVATVTIDVCDYGPEEGISHGKNITHFLADGGDPAIKEKTMETIGGDIDCLFLDDGHYYCQIVAQVDLWRPSVRKGGWIVFHDINPLANIGPNGVQPPEVQVTRYWNELDGEKEEIVATEEHSSLRGLLPNGGLGVLKV